jgi:hypothetical protein
VKVRCPGVNDSLCFDCKHRQIHDAHNGCNQSFCATGNRICHTVPVKRKAKADIHAAFARGVKRGGGKIVISGPDVILRKAKAKVKKARAK